MLVRRYEKPEIVRGIILADEARVDTTQSLWEVVRASEGAERMLGYELAPDDIVQTRPWRGVFIDDQPGEKSLYAVINAADIINCIRWRSE